MYCTNCGKQNEDNSKFCVHCGAGISNNTENPQQNKEFTAPRSFQPYSSIDPNQGIVNKTAFKGKQVSFGTSGSVSFKGGGKKPKTGLKIVLGIAAVATVATVGVIAATGGFKGKVKPTTTPIASPTASVETNYTPEYMVGTYTYDSNNKEDELTYIHVNCFLEISADGTMRDWGTWQGIGTSSNQTTSHDYIETWSIVDNKLVSINDSGFKRTWDINGDYITYMDNFGYSITYKKMN
ncbi:MAG: hypothetical protein BWX97_00385 [Firmicutes bacterium ADurb.Bin146]|nr:MAG: hypothetical protein BWX97_00385 [Firmicutes bacterium ADurb.Bin146]